MIESLLPPRIEFPDKNPEEWAMDASFLAGTSNRNHGVQHGDVGSMVSQLGIDGFWKSVIEPEQREEVRQQFPTLVDECELKTRMRNKQAPGPAK
jgi:hypothetical protein